MVAILYLPGPDVTTPPPCQDKLTNCASFGTTVCSGIYEPWAKDNCRLYCGKCNPGMKFQYFLIFWSGPLQNIFHAQLK